MQGKVKIVQITWEDITSQCGWIDTDDIDIEICICNSVGFLLKKTKKYILIAQTMAGDVEMCGNVKKIPMGVVKKIKILK